CLILLFFDLCIFFFSSRRRHTRSTRDWSSDVCSSDLSRERIEIMHRATEELRQSGLAERALKVGDLAPAFELDNQDGRLVRSADLLADGPLVIAFFRGHW